jgi:Rieske Fe-S protein
MVESLADGETRRDFFFPVAGAAEGGGETCLAWPRVDRMNPTADVLTPSLMDVEIGSISAGQGSHYDTAGRSRKGPAPKNLVVPPHVFGFDTMVKIG